MFGTIRAKLRFQFFSLSPERWRRYAPMLLTICASLGLTIGLFVVMRQWEWSEKQAEFDYASSHYVEAIRQATERIELTHEVMRQNYYGSPSVSRKEFSLCAEPFLARVPSLKVLQWAPRVARADRGNFEGRAQREGWPKYRIIEPDSRGQLVPAEQRNEYFPIWYAATKSGFKARFGWDFAANPVLRKAIEECRDTGRFVVSKPIDLSKIGIHHPLVQTFLPVYREPQTVRTVEDRRRRLEGLLVGLCQIDDLVEYALSYADGPQGIDVEFLDESLPAGQRLLHHHASRTRQPGDAAQTNAAETEPTGIHYAGTLEFGGQRWSLVCTPAPNFFPAHASWRSWTILAIGLAVTWLSASYIFSATTRTQRIQRLVDQRTAELRKKDDQLRQSQKLEAVGALAGGIAHEFNNLLQAIGGYTRYAMEELKPEGQPYKDLQSVLQAADRAAALTRQLLSFSRRQSVERKNLDANQMVADLTKMLRPLLGEHLHLKLLLGKGAGTVFADAGSFQQVLINLCLNARDAMPSGGDIVVKTERVNVTPAFAELYADVKPGRYMVLSVADTGHGMTPEIRQHIFEPFFTTKPVGQGTGLGLPTVYGIVQQHEGAIHVFSEPGRGTTFKIYLPAIEAPDEAPNRTTILSVAGGAETILLAEDDPIVREIAQRILVNGGYTVLTAADGEEALDVFRAHRHEISLVLLDAVMPKLTGAEVYRRLKNEYPETRVVFCSGYDPETAQSNFIVDERLRLVEKPYKPETLLRTVREVLDAEELCPAH
jgi:signal transduction histidine kinase/ActR/RegA family two-component response regulator